MADDDPYRQPYAGSCTANSRGHTDPTNEENLFSDALGVAVIGPVPPNKRLVVESVSVDLTTLVDPHGGYVFLLNMQLTSGAFTIFMDPPLVGRDWYYRYQASTGTTGGRRAATYAIRFCVEPGDSIHFTFATLGGDGTGSCYVSGYYLDT